jgi:type IV secretory pathway VirJ component
MNSFRRAAFTVAACLSAFGLASSSLAASSALPLTVISTQGSGDTLAVMYSGDGGWAPLDRAVAARFAQAGIPVVGYNSLTYFLQAKTPEVAAADLASVLHQYSGTWSRKHIILVGYSFGADALPIIAQHLPADLRGRIKMMALLSPSDRGDLKFQPGSWLNLSSKSAYAIAPTLANLKGVPMVCVYGDAEKNPACPTFSSSLIRSVKLPGDHHYNSDYASLSHALLQSAGF